MLYQTNEDFYVHGAHPMFYLLLVDPPRIARSRDNYLKYI